MIIQPNKFLVSFCQLNAWLFTMKHFSACLNNFDISSFKQFHKNLLNAIHEIAMPVYPMHKPLVHKVEQVSIS